MLQDGAPAEEDLQKWGQHSSTETVPDSVMRTIGAELPGLVSFVFACKVPPLPQTTPCLLVRHCQTPVMKRQIEGALCRWLARPLQAKRKSRR